MTKKETTTSSTHMIAEANALDVDVSPACQSRLVAECEEFRSERWCAENAETIRALNDFIEREGLPLARYRKY